AVPSLFHPMALTDLYAKPPNGDGPWIPQLVDGGVHDNQGSEALIDEHCGLLLVSDACGQMKDRPAPNPGVIAVQRRTIDVLMDRVREEEFEVARHEALDDLVFMHLRHRLGRPVLECGDAECRMPRDEGPWQVAPEVQRLLARVRTDLDAFSDVEAFALMADGYLVADECLGEVALKRMCASLRHEAEIDAREAWPFDVLRPYLAEPTEELLTQLRVAEDQWVRARIEHPEWHKTRRSRKRLVGLGTAALAVGVTAVVIEPGLVLAGIALGFVGLALLGVAALAALALAGVIPGRTGRWITEHVGVAVGLVFGVAAKVQLRWLTPRFLRQGRVDTLGPPPDTRLEDQSSRSHSSRGGYEDPEQ
ncbi:MAG: hypothetical protein ACQGVC_21605, partial [Myxococcota bacterium]